MKAVHLDGENKKHESCDSQKRRMRPDEYYKCPEHYVSRLIFLKEEGLCVASL